MTAQTSHATPPGIEPAISRTSRSGPAYLPT
jgi:hypothetical protein